MRVHTVHHEREHARLLGRRPDERQARHPRQRRRPVRQQLTFVGRDAIHPDPGDVIHRRRQPYRARDVRGPRFEFVRQGVVRGLLERHRADHVAATLIRRHLLEQTLLAVQHANPGRSVELVAREHVEVGVERLDVHRHVLRRLRSVDEYRHASAMRRRNHLLDGINRPERVRQMDDRDQPRVRPEKLLVLLELQHSLVRDRNHPQGRALFSAHHLPGHDVGVVLHGGDHHLVSRAETCTAERLGHQIDGLGGVAGEDDFARRGGVDEALHRRAGVFERLGGALAEQVDAAVHVRVVLAVVGRQRVEDRTRLLGRRGVVQVHERLAVHGLPKNGKVLADAAHVEADLSRRGDAGDAGHWQRSVRGAFMPRPLATRRAGALRATS